MAINIGYLTANKTSAGDEVVHSILCGRAVNGISAERQENMVPVR